MKIEELPHIEIRRILANDEGRKNWYMSQEREQLMKRNGYYPVIDCMSDSYSSLSRVLDKDCVVAYVTDNSQTTFLVKTRCKYVAFICLSKKLADFLSSNSTRRITKMYEYQKHTFMNFVEGENLIITDKELWDRYLKAKILESLGK